MRAPADDFAELFRNVRKRKGLPSTKLAHALGKSRIYFGRWEIDAKAGINMKVLDEVCRFLEATPAEHRELRRLAYLREAPPEAKSIYESGRSDPDANLLESLLSIPHEWPSEPPNPTSGSHRTRILIGAVSWLLARAAARNTEALNPFTQIRWPDSLVRLGIVPKVANNDAIEVPDAILSEEMPFVSQLQDPITPQDSGTQSLAMARAYRRLLFADPERTAKATSLLQHWSYDRSQTLAECVSIRFKATDLHERFGCVDVSCEVLESIGRRSLAFLLWEGRNKNKSESPRGAWHTKAEPRDNIAIYTLARQLPIAMKNYELGQDSRDAAYITKSEVFPAILSSIRNTHGVAAGSEAEIEEALKTSPSAIFPLNSSIYSEPWRIAAIDHALIRARARALEATVPPFTPTSPMVLKSPKTKKGQAARKRKN